MNKIKLLYDVITTMKEKDELKGTIQVDATKDLSKIFSLDKEFEKNMATGEVKATIRTEMDCEGKKVKHESKTEFNMKECQGHKHHAFLKHICSQHFQSHTEKMKCCGVKEKLTHFAYALNLFNSMKVEEQADKSVLLLLNLNDIPEDIKKHFHEKMKYMKEQGQQEQDCCMKEFCCVQRINAEVKVRINKNYEVESVLIAAEGIVKDDSGKEQNVTVTADLNLIW